MAASTRGDAPRAAIVGPARGCGPPVPFLAGLIHHACPCASLRVGLCLDPVLTVIARAGSRQTFIVEDANGMSANGPRAAAIARPKMNRY